MQLPRVWSPVTFRGLTFTMPRTQNGHGIVKDILLHVRGAGAYGCQRWEAYGAGQNFDLRADGAKSVPRPKYLRG